jgi:hypothetical protein
MRKYLAIAAASLIVTASSMDTAFARHLHRFHHINAPSGGTSTTGVTTGTNPRGNDAELGGNNANSGSGPNSVGHAQGGNSGASGGGGM